jgi:glycosyltransferase involved in cell wall biosynthesis
VPTEPLAPLLRVAVDVTPLLGRPTGVGAFCSGLLGGLASRGDVAVAAFAVSWRRRRGVAGLVPPGVSVVDRPMPARPLHVAWRHAGVPPLEWFTGPADVVHGTNFVVPPSRRAARVATVHDLTTVRFPELCDGPTLAYPAFVRRALARGAWIHTPSAAVAAEVVDVLGAPTDRVRPVHSGVPALPPPDRAAALGHLPPGTGRYVLAVGTAEPRKDLPGLVAAFDELAGDRPDLALVLCGPPGWGSEALDSALDASAHRRRIALTGWVDDATLSGLLSHAAVLAYPSRYEGFGFPPLQAMATGVPVVATRAGALPEVLGDAASMVAVGDTEALAEALARVLDDEAVRADLVARGRERAATYTWERCAAGLADLYRDAAR